MASQHVQSKIIWVVMTGGSEENLTLKLIHDRLERVYYVMHKIPFDIFCMYVIITYVISWKIMTMCKVGCLVVQYD